MTENQALIGVLVRIKAVLFSSLLFAATSPANAAVRAAAIPSNPGDFIVALQPGGPAAGEMPDCDPELTSIGSLFMAGQTSVSATCSMASTSASTVVSGTASNPTLAASTGDAGFTSGTIAADCKSSQVVNLQLTITMAGSTMNSFSGKVFQACAFVMQFPDASSSRLLGTIELNGLLGSEDGAVVNNTVNVSIEAKVFVTSGSGAFAGYSGSGTFTQSQEININPNSQGTGGDSAIAQPPAVTNFCTTKGISSCTAQGIGAWCTANQGPQGSECSSILAQVKTAAVAKSSVADFAASDNNKMSLKLVKSPGGVRILSPAPAPGSPKAAAKVTASTKVKVTAPVGATCTVKTNTGKIVGVGKVSGKYSLVNVAPRARSYAFATSIVSTCKTKTGKVLTSNRVKIKP